MNEKPKKVKPRIIKANNANLAGKVKLEFGKIKPCSANAKAGTNQSSSSPKQVKVLESTKDFVLLEIGCDCGNAIKLKCNYADFFNE